MFVFAETPDSLHHIIAVHRGRLFRALLETCLKYQRNQASFYEISGRFRFKQYLMLTSEQEGCFAFRAYSIKFPTHS